MRVAREQPGRWQLVPAAGAAVIACAGLLAGATGITSAQRSIVPLTGVGILLGSAALALAYDERRRTVVRVLATAVLLLGALTLAEYALDRSLVDWLFDAPRRMTLNSAVCLVVLGVSLLVLDRGGAVLRPSDLGGLTIGLTAILALVGHLFDVPGLQRGVPASPLTPMSIPTSLAMLALSAGLLCARPDAGLAALVRSPGPGGMLARRLAPAAILAPIALAYLRLEGQRAGLYATTEGLALYCVSLIAIFVGLIIATARTLERVDAERRSVEARERAVLDTTVDAVLTVGENGRVLELNAAAESMFGAAAGRELAEIVEVGEGPALGRVMELTAHGTGGREFPAEVTITRLDETFVVHVRDIAERVEAERVARRLAAVVEYSADAIIAVGLDQAVASWNQGAERVYGYPREEAIGRPLVELILPPDRLAGIDERTERLEQAGSMSGDAMHKRRDGTTFPVEATASWIRDATGEPVGLSLIARDVTERRKLEEQLRQSQKMEAVGQLAGGVAHDFNNLLTVITGYGDLARALVAGGPGAQELKEIDRAAQRASRLTTQLLAFSRRQLLDPVVLDLGTVVRELIPMLRRLIGEDIEVLTRLATGLPAVRADAGQLEQVIVNLAVNARDAMPDGGTLTFETRAVVVDSDDGPRDHVCLCVTDSGTGIAPDALPHIFEPFYTTKPVGEGTGLGLATVHGAVTQSGGRVTVYSEPGHGTSFKVFLPATADAGGPEVVAPVPDDRLEGDETLLVCEDEEGVRALLERVLLNAGYRVLVAGRPTDALAQAEAEPGRIHGLVSDVIMPDMPGPELARRLQDLRPGLRTLFLSGYTADTVHGRGNLPHGSAFLEKPFDRVSLLRTLRELLDRGEP